MSELFGPLPRHAIAGVPLGLAVLAPLFAGGFLAIFGSWVDERRALRDLAERASARAPASLVVALAALASSLVIAMGLTAALQSPSGLVVAPAWTLARVGSIEAALGFDADVGRGALALVVALGGAVVALRGDRRDPASSGSASAWRALALAAALAALLADGLATALLALGGALVATGAGAIRGRWGAAAASLLVLSLAGVTLAWGLDGRWLDGLGGNYLSDYGPRFAAVRDAAPSGPRVRGPVAEPKGTISMTSVPGSNVYVGVADDASLRGRTALATSPFVKVPVAATLQKIAIVPGAAAIVGGDGIEIGLTDNVDIRAEDDVVVTPLGGTWIWRDLEAQLMLHEADGKHPLRSELANKQLASMSLPTAVLLLVFLAAGLAWLDGPRRIARALATRGALEASLIATTLAVATVAPAARLATLVPLAGAVPLLLAAAAVVAFGAIVAASRGAWLTAGAATVVVGASLVAVAADASPVLALAVAMVAAVTTRFAEPTPRRAPHPWIAGPEEDDPVETTPVAAPRTAAVAAAAAVNDAEAEAEAPPREPSPEKKKGPKKPAEARS